MNFSHPLVSVIVPTRNSEEFLEKCLRSIKEQTYKNTELIVVDNFSSDNTKDIAQTFTTNVYDKGPERSTQRNFGAEKSSGEYLLMVDSDMELSRNVIRACVEKAKKENSKALIILERSSGSGFWAKCKEFERSFYLGIDWMESVRFFEKHIFDNVGGYDIDMVSGEDWDLSQKIMRGTDIARVNELITHHEGDLNFMEVIRKKTYYAKKFRQYSKKNKNSGEYKKQTSLVRRYFLLLSKPKELLRHPLLGVGMLILKTCEFGVGGISYLIQKKEGEE